MANYPRLSLKVTIPPTLTSGKMNREGLRSLQEQIERGLQEQEAVRKERVRRQEAVQREKEELEGYALLVGQADQALLEVSTKVLGQSTSSVDKLVTAGLKLVFEDLDLEFKTTIERLRGKTAVKFALLEDGRTSPIMSSYGGGVLAIAGVLLRVVVIVSLGLRRLMVLDETLAHLSPQYVDAASSLLRKLGKDLNFTILMVSHEAEFALHADRKYLASRTPSGVKFEVSI